MFIRTITHQLHQAPEPAVSEVHAPVQVELSLAHYPTEYWRCKIMKELLGLDLLKAL